MESRYLQIADRLRDETLELGPNALLPSELHSARRFAVSRVTTGAPWAARAGRPGLPGARAGSVPFLSVLRAVDHRVVAHEARYFALPVAKPLDLEPLDERPISALLAEVVGVAITRLDGEMEFTAASRDSAAVLGVTPGALIAASTYTQYLETGWAVARGVVSYRIDRVRFRFSSGDAPWLVPPRR